MDSVIVLVVSIVSGLVFLLTMNAKIAQQELSLNNVQELVKRIEVDQKERMSRLERDQAERATRLEAAIKDQQALFQSQILPKFQR